MTPPKPPTGLKTPGRRLWIAVAEPYVLTPAELQMLAEACRTADELDRLERAVRALPELIVSGSTGQPKAHHSSVRSGPTGNSSSASQPP